MSTSELPSPLAELLAPPIETIALERPKRRRRTTRVADVLPQAPEVTGAPRSSRASRSPKPARGDELVVGALPIARLLPPEVLATSKARTTRNLMLLVILGVLVLAVAATGGSYLLAQQAQSDLAAVQARNSSVLAQQAKYAPVRSVQNELKLAQAAQRVGVASEIDWSTYFAKIHAVLPSNVTITALSGETASPTTSVGQDAAPLSLSRVATVSATISAPDETAIADTLDALQKLPGFAGAVPGPMSQSASTPTAGAPADGAAGNWTTTLTISLTDAAFADRFANAGK